MAGAAGDPFVKHKNAGLLGLLAVALLTVVGCYFWNFAHRQSTLSLPGIVEIQEVRLGSKVGGRVEEVLVEEGDKVYPGQPLVKFQVPELEAQFVQARARLEAAQAELDRAVEGPREEEKRGAKAAAEAAHARLKRLQEGWRAEEKRQSASELEAAAAELRQAEEDLERVKKLYLQKSVARADYDAAQAVRDRAKGRANFAQARHDMVLTGSRKEDIEEADADWRKAKAKWEELEAGTRKEDLALARARVAEARGKLQELETSLKEALVLAPENALVEVVAVRKGDLVQPNQPVIRVLRAEDLWVKVYVPETELGKIRLQQEVAIKIDSYPDKRFAGKVQQIASISEFTPRNVQSVDERRYQVFAVKVRIDNPQGVFKAGMAAEVLLPLQPAP